MGFFAGLRSIVRTPSIALAAASLSLVGAGCGLDLGTVFTQTGGGQTTSAGGGGAGGMGGIGGGTGGLDPTTTTTGTGATTTTTSTSTGTTTSTTSTTGTSTAVCGNGVCESGEDTGNCSPDCPPGACSHSVCEWSQTPLQNGCTGSESACVAAVCNQDAYCCDNQWDDQCIGAANQLCNDICCGNGQCTGEQCDVCLADCGSCSPTPTCPHTVCYGASNAEPLNTTDCYDPCIDEVCAVIDMDTDNCCVPEPPTWSAECTAKAKELCGEWACITDVCAAMPSCCTTNWTTECVNLVTMTPSCATSCNCAHSVCSNGPDNTPLVKGCNPCVDAVCEADAYCCNNDWDGICVGEVGTLCGVACN
jgi:hypothetical protein